MPVLVERFGDVARQEYLAIGLRVSPSSPDRSGDRAPLGADWGDFW
jgi:hypothetical protein